MECTYRYFQEGGRVELDVLLTENLALSHKISKKTKKLSAFARAIHTMHNKSKDMESETPAIPTVNDARIPKLCAAAQFFTRLNCKTY
jgi:hypothetical protein